ncbi:hypothetical protein OPV22_004490 [Ensete ventricosum]|uniref:Uncharacterized protein n=1 Tax=Ensete ventricosum TaxID=4639 RepID=A0AAV8S3Y7_ENSVE|nr:hypothetical protein OPV22_004490 [Ensete ventricosum]RWW05037.1 hypothetical protein GW17_00031711 [Ensete ventricosum]RWW55128.1 hypothetical protein BHE74_00038290 [Ensete ventricosum]RZR83989.1 hypothetical protein BHM03_00010707 [Ensete ventricosum]
MDLQLEELQALSMADVVRESVAIPRGAPRTFALITLALVFPLSFAILAHTLFTHPILLQLQRTDVPGSNWLLLLLYQFAYLLFLFTFSLLSTAAVVFTVASLYAAKPVSFSSSLLAVRPIFPRLFRTFLWVALLMLLYNLVFALAVLLLLLFSPLQGSPSPLFVLFFALVLLAFLAVHVYISAFWHLASVVSVLEPLCGLAAMAKSRDLLRGRSRMAAVLVVAYLGTCGLVGVLFRAIVVKGPNEEGSLGVTSVSVKVLVGGALVAVLVMVNLVGLLVQSVFYYVCKSYHHQQIDKSALYDHLGGYLGEYVPLKSSIQMENI